MNEKSLIASVAETSTSFYGVLAGLAFTALVLLFTFRNSLPLSGVFLTLTLFTTFLFIYASALSASASGNLRDGELEIAKLCLKIADHFGSTGFILMLIEIGLTAFYAGWMVLQ